MFKVGDIVRIKSVQELRNEGYQFNCPWVIDKWHNSICEVVNVYGEHRHKLQFLEEVVNPHDENHICHQLSAYDWSEFELEKYAIFLDKENYKEVTELSIDKMFEDV